jgi:hypothetical protein
MPTDHLIPDDIKAKYHVKAWRNATGILTTACPNEWAEILDGLRGFKLLRCPDEAPLAEVDDAED